ncbi:MAG: hypothetical protein QM695_09710 [Micropruina sp.]
MELMWGRFGWWRWIRVLICVIAVLSLSIVTGSAARANSFGPVFADNGSHTFFYDDDIGSTRRSAMENARINALDGPTVMTNVPATKDR